MPAIHDYHLVKDLLMAGALLFALGAVGFVCRRNLVVMMLSVGIMLQGTTLTLTALSALHGNRSGQVLALLALALSALEGACALAMILVFARREKSLDISLWHRLRESIPPQQRSEERGFRGRDLAPKSSPLTPHSSPLTPHASSVERGHD